MSSAASASPRLPATRPMAPRARHCSAADFFPRRNEPRSGSCTFFATTAPTSRDSKPSRPGTSRWATAISKWRLRRSGKWRRENSGAGFGRHTGLGLRRAQGTGTANRLLSHHQLASLLVVELCVYTVSREQLQMRAGLDDSPLIAGDDDVGVH